MHEEPITTLAILGKHLQLTDKERAFDTLTGVLPLAIPPYFLSLIDKDDPKDPLLIQVVPTIDEGEYLEDEHIDPLSEREHSVTERLIHRIPAALPSCDRHLRHVLPHCFRRRSPDLPGPCLKS